MAKLAAALHEEAIHGNPRKARLVPHDAYCRDVDELSAQLRQSVRLNGWGNHSALFVDGIPKRFLGSPGTDLDRAVVEALGSEGFSVDWINLSERLGIRPGDFHASHDLVEKTRQVVRTADWNLFVVLGSGSITDVVKQALFLEGITAPLVSIPTALTVTAFTSAFAIIDFHGAKRTQMSREVSAAFWVESILRCAPHRMSRAGYGDLLARFVAYGDWYLGACLGVMDRYDETALRLMEPFAPGIRDNASGFSMNPLPEETCRCISAALAMAGIAMSVSGETTPLSGFEHVISHGLDFLRLTSGRDLVFHGEQVGLACLTSAHAIDWLLAQSTLEHRPWLADPEAVGIAALNRLMDEAPLAEATPSSHRGVPLQDLKQRRRAAGQEFIREYSKKAARWKESMAGLPRFIARWPETKTHLREITVRTDEMARLAALAGLPAHPEDTVPPTSQQEFQWAVAFAPFVRLRTNVADVLFWMGKNPLDIVYDQRDCSP